MEGEAGFIGYHSMADYQAAIAAAPPNTMIKLGDLDRDLVRCSTCDSTMERKAAPYHKHPKKCDACGNHFDENTHKHTPIHVTHPRGAGDVTFTSGCKEEAL